MRKIACLWVVLVYATGVAAQGNAENNLRPDWLKFQDGKYELLGTDEKPRHTVYMKVEAGSFPGCLLSLQSTRTFFVFINGQLAGEYLGKKIMRIDSLAEAHGSGSLIVGIYQRDINQRDLKTMIVTRAARLAPAKEVLKPPTYFRDFVSVAGICITLLFLVTLKTNPKLASDYLSVIRIFSLREGDDAQSNARLTSSSNVQFYVICSLLIGFYMLIVLRHLPDAYALPSQFQAHSFWTACLQWVRLSVTVLGLFFVKIMIIFALTRLFGMRGLARVHFFNWVRLLMIALGFCSALLFTYFILRGQSEQFFIAFLSLVIAMLTAWIVIVFLKLNNKTEHSMFHLFSYICATEIIPLLVTIKVLFQ